MQALSFEVEPVAGTEAVIVRADGYVDTHTASRLEAVLDEQMDEGARSILLDLSGVDYVSSAGWGVLISVVRRARALGGDLRLVGMQSEVYDVYELLEFPSILRSHENVDAALASLVH